MKTFAVASLLATSAVAASVRVNYAAVFPGTVGAGATTGVPPVTVTTEGTLTVIKDVNNTRTSNATDAALYQASIVARNLEPVVPGRKRQLPGASLVLYPTTLVGAACVLAPGADGITLQGFSAPEGFSTSGSFIVPVNAEGFISPALTAVIINGAGVPAFCAPLDLTNTQTLPDNGSITNVFNTFVNGTAANGTAANGASGINLNGVANGNSENHLSQINQQSQNVNINLGGLEDWVKEHTKAHPVDNRNGTHPKHVECRSFGVCKEAGEWVEICGKAFECEKRGIKEASNSLQIAAGDYATINVAQAADHSAAAAAINGNANAAVNGNQAAAQVAANTAAAPAKDAAQVAAQVAAPANAQNVAAQVAQKSGANKAGFAGVAVALAFVFALL